MALQPKAVHNACSQIAQKISQSLQVFFGKQRCGFCVILFDFRGQAKSMSTDGKTDQVAEMLIDMGNKLKQQLKPTIISDVREQ